MTANRDNILCKKGDKIRAREFHYFDSDCNGNGFTAVKNDRQWECVNVDKNLFAGFPHLHFFANINFAENFMKSCEEYKCTKSEKLDEQAIENAEKKWNSIAKNHCTVLVYLRIL